MKLIDCFLLCTLNILCPSLGSLRVSWIKIWITQVLFSLLITDGHQSSGLYFFYFTLTSFITSEYHHGIMNIICSFNIYLLELSNIKYCTKYIGFILMYCLHLQLSIWIILNKYPPHMQITEHTSSLNFFFIFFSELIMVPFPSDPIFQCSSKLYSFLYLTGYFRLPVSFIPVIKMRWNSFSPLAWHFSNPVQAVLA